MNVTLALQTRLSHVRPVCLSNLDSVTFSVLGVTPLQFKPQIF